MEEVISLKSVLCHFLVHDIKILEGMGKGGQGDRDPSCLEELLLDLIKVESGVCFQY